MDYVMELGATFGPIILAGMGLYVSIRPPARKGWVHWVWFAAFAGIGALTATASFLELKSTDESQTRLGTRQEDMNREILDLKSSVDRLVTGVRQIGRVGDYPDIDQKETESLVTTLKPFVNNSVIIDVSCLMNNVNACIFAQKWQDILKSAGWKTSGVNQGVYMPPPSGVFINVTSPDTPGAGVIQHAFATAGITANGQIDPKIPANTIDIVVGAYRSPN